jgi:hypothetical protein
MNHPSSSTQSRLLGTRRASALRLRDSRLQRIEAIVERQQRMPPEGNDDRLGPRRKGRSTWLSWGLSEDRQRSRVASTSRQSSG